MDFFLLDKFRLFFLVIIFSLGGCASNLEKMYVPPTVSSPTVGIGTGAAIGVASSFLIPGMVLGGAVGTIIGHNMQMKESFYLQYIDKLQRNKVQVMQTGDEVRFILLAKDFFTLNTPNMLANSEHIIKMVANFINMLPATVVKVVGFYNKFAVVKDHLIANNRALTVQNILSHHPLNTRLLYVEDIGGAVCKIGANNVCDRLEIIVNPREHVKVG